MKPLPAAQPATEKSLRERLLALAIFGVLAFNYPLLSLFDRPALVWGIPLLYLYLFSVWALLLLLLYRVMRRTTAAPGPETGDNGPPQPADTRGDAN